jgi:hypothetical protein
MSLWSIARSPLMFGGDLPSNDDFTESLITNDEVLAVDQTGAHGYTFHVAPHSSGLYKLTPAK